MLINNKIKHEFSAPYSPHQNGTAERAWRSLFEMSRCLLINAELPKFLWTYAVKKAAYVRNRCFNNRIKRTPFEAFTGKQPNVSNMHTFGSKCFAYVQEKKKLDDRSEQGIFVGYDSCSPAYLIYFPKKNIIRRVRCVKFDNTECPTDTDPSAVPTIVDDSFMEPKNENVPNNDSSLKQHPKRNRTMPKHLSDYITENDPEMSKIAKVSIDYCYRTSEIPTNYSEAVSSEQSLKWMSAMKEEIDNLQENDTYQLVPLPKNKSIIGSKWVYSVKLGANNEEKYKARLVAKGYSQQQSVDYNETFSPTAKLTSIRMLMQVAVQNYILRQLDVKSAYLNATIDEEIYLEQPEGFVKTNDSGEKLVCKLNKSIYGLKQSGRNWNNTFHTFLCSENFVQSSADHCVYTKHDKDSVIITIMWVDDIIIASNNNAAVNDIISSLSEQFRMKDMGTLSYFLGIEFSFCEGYIKMSQSKCIAKMLSKFNMIDCNPKAVPCDPCVSKLNCDDSTYLSDSTLYKEIVGSLIYLMTCTRPDLSFVVTYLSQYMSRPTVAHLSLAKNVLKYLKGTKNYCLTFTKCDHDLKLVGYCDSDWGNSTDRRSISGYCFHLNEKSSLISWKSKKQNVIALSSCEAEYVAMTVAVQEAKFLRQLLSDLTNSDFMCVNLFADNQGAILLAKNPVHHQRTKHIDVKYHFIRLEIQHGTITFEYVSTNDNVADLFTKPVSKIKLNKFNIIHG